MVRHLQCQTTYSLVIRSTASLCFLTSISHRGSQVYRSDTVVARVLAVLRPKLRITQYPSEATGCQQIICLCMEKPTKDPDELMRWRTADLIALRIRLYCPCHMPLAILFYEWPAGIASSRRSFGSGGCSFGSETAIVYVCLLQLFLMLPDVKSRRASSVSV